MQKQNQKQQIQISTEDKKFVEKAVKQIVKDYGDVIKRLANT